MQSSQEIPARANAVKKPRRTTADTIVEAAIRHFSEHGIEATTMEHIAAAAKISRRTVYHHFSSRDAVLEAAVERNALDQINRMLESVPATLSFAEYLCECALYIVRHVPESPFFKVHISDAAAIKSSHIYFTSAQMQEQWFGGFQESYIRALRERTINPELELREIIKWLGRITMSLMQYPDKATSEEELRRQINKFFINALRYAA
jgi:AcrR family transcriptional regulator